MDIISLFEPPFNSDLLIKRKKIRKELLESNVDFIDKKIAILGGSTTHDIKDILELFLLNNGIRPTFYESEYGQYWQDSMFPNLELDSFEPDIIYIHTTYRNILHFPMINDPVETVNQYSDETYEHFSVMWDQLHKKYKAVVIQNNFDFPDWRLLGNSDASNIHGRINFITRLNMRFAEYAQQHDYFFIHDINYLSAYCGLTAWSDPFYWHMYKCTPAQSTIPYLAHSVANIIKSIYGKNKKAFALDLDNTLWGGIVGDDGAENIEVGQETSVGQAYSEFQSYIKAHKQLGVILNIVSKNDMENAMSGLRRPDMVLKPDDFIMIKANWEPKSQNLMDIAHTLSLTPDSFVFVDDNPAEREIIKQQIPNAVAPDIGDEPEYYIRAIDKMGYFEVTTISNDDASRTLMYKENAERSRAEALFSNYDDYLRSLEMKAEISAFSSLYLSRISQLTNKSNQFNLTTLRCSQEDITAYANDDRYITLYGKLSDKFGDNGVVSVIIGKINGDNLDLIVWLMSCRVLKRNMEFAMMDTLVNKAKAQNIKTINGFYYPTNKNAMVRDFYKTMDFEKVSEDEHGNSAWKYIIPDEYINKQNVIDVNEPN